MPSDDWACGSDDAWGGKRDDHSTLIGWHVPEPLRCKRLGGSGGPRYAAASIIRDAFSPIMIDGALVLPDVRVGMIDASATRRPWMPCTRN